MPFNVFGSSTAPPLGASTALDYTRQSRVILLSFFDGIGSAALGCQRLGVDLAAFLSWETDPSCVRVLQKHFPKAQHMGDFELTPPAVVADKVLRIWNDSPDAEVLTTAGPPCPDYSFIKEDAPGAEGESGRLFQAWCDWLALFEQCLQHKVLLLVECVVMKPEWASHFDECLQANHIVGDSADWGIISRPRFWWTRIAWPSGPLAAASPSGKKWPKLEWRNFNNHPKLVLQDQKTTGMTSWPVSGLSFSKEVQNGRCLMPCLTTPAPTDEGRPPPKKSQHERPEKPETMQRWKAAGQQFAPWHYRSHHLMTDAQGNLVTPSAKVKEFMHKLPTDYTKVQGNSDRDRHRQLGNGWHMGVAQRMLWLVLMAGQVIQQAGACMFGASPWYDPTPVVHVPRPLHPDGCRPIERAATWWLRSQCCWGPQMELPPTPLLPITLNATQHMAAARQMDHPATTYGPLEDSLQYVLFMQLWIGPDLPRWRDEVNADLRLLVQDVQMDSQEWLRGLPDHVRRAYAHGMHRASAEQADKAFQAIATLVLLRLLQFPEWQQLAQELSYGFQMMGPLPMGPNWRPRKDQKYANPADKEDFQHVNQAHIRRTCTGHVRLEHWDTMLKEVTDEWDLHRIDGPFRAPPDWPVQTVSPDETKWKLYDVQGPVYAAKSFAISQIGSDDLAKIRRGEDWLRSGHNSTVEALDQPTHHTVQTFAELGVATNCLMQGSVSTMLSCPLLPMWSQWGFPPDAQLSNSLDFLRHQPGAECPLLSGNDHEGAYRNFPLRDPREAYLLLWTPKGLTLWRHNVLLFGATASVWAYNRMGDVMCFLSRVLGLVPMLHYVDDYGSVDAPPLARSAFDFFVNFNATLNLRTKPSKAQEPAVTHKMQGVDIHMQSHQILLCPTESRKTKLKQEITTCLTKNRMAPDLAAKVAGKLVFVNTTTFGKVGRAPTKQLYQRQHMDPSLPDTLTNALEIALRTLVHILDTISPRSVSCKGPRRGDVIYADAFFLLGDRMKAAHSMLKDHCPNGPVSVGKLTNGWGAVYLPCADMQVKGLAIRGSVPDALLQRFTSNKAYIYFLEAFAQLITVFFFCTVLDPLVTNFIDNEAAKHAVIKGYCRERAMCNLLGSFWCLCAQNGINPWLERVTSDANPSDEISRDIWDLVMHEQWTVLKVDLSPVLPILNKVAQDSVFAHKEAPTALRDELAKQAVPQIWRHHPQLLRLQQRDSCVICRAPCPITCTKCLWRCCSGCSGQFSNCFCRQGLPQDFRALKEEVSKEKRCLTAGWHNRIVLSHRPRPRRLSEASLPAGPKDSCPWRIPRHRPRPRSLF